MAANKKLTKVLAGRTAVRLVWQGATAVVQFDDGSTMTVQTAADAAGGANQASPAGSPPGAAAGAAGGLGRVRGVRQQDTTLNVDFYSGSTLTLRTAEPTSSVLVRARDQTLEYAD
jgi:hypothetical protein